MSCRTNDVIKPLISIIIPIHNGEEWIDTCFESILRQTIISVIHVEIAICDDASTDKTLEILDKWKDIFNKMSISLHIFKNETGLPKGVGYAKNRAVEISSGDYLCFQDIDDIMLPKRIETQYKLAKTNQSAIIGGRFKRKPENSTERFVRWANNLIHEQLQIQIYTSYGPTVIMPTWFCHRNVFNNVPGGFSEKGYGTPEDLIFFYAHIENNGSVLRTDEVILEYLFHPGATTLSIKQETIFELRVQQVEKRVLFKWPSFTIWNAGKEGRKFFRTLREKFQKRVIAFCDVDKKKIGKKYTPYDHSIRRSKVPIPIEHYSIAKPPFIICVKLDMTNGIFEKNLNSLNLKEDKDYILFN
ncbi:UDP-GlcNAc:betaGal beta-1,3-N-acetylglucosaminyltransferase-like protein 1 isoform X1 [Phymastichus coffea]|uniref:UDP-GlcNAc:betaGal beta-1,3-N-acetylglucosaminyltransferase-like protein 1 isoform X1 n=1 Tax=Phymastichus coffea TaxID=108790 RepID=UPI00273A7DE3|nr:UDP-GlcNAc:betaGal beta-1,3-N-acetylglucosaminyltransferase-like protein 1 isoform X1 [Phymastichus coffea]